MKLDTEFQIIWWTAFVGCVTFGIIAVFVFVMLAIKLFLWLGL